jgi:DNA invertase Pin-like site-specific DNA recombinase
MRAAIYARYSTDLQSASSIDDQVRLCRERIAREKDQLVQVYSDRAISGASLCDPESNRCCRMQLAASLMSSTPKRSID